ASDVARDAAGAIVTLGEGDAFERLPPVVAHLPASSKEQSVRVRLGGVLGTTGQLELACVEQAPAGRRFRLEFQLRDAGASTSPPRAPPPPASLAPPSISPSAQMRAQVAPSRLAEAVSIADKVFGKKGDASPREVKDVLRDLDKTLGDRLTWTMETCRQLADK